MIVLVVMVTFAVLLWALGKAADAGGERFASKALWLVTGLGVAALYIAMSSPR